MKFCHLHLHSSYSILDGVANPEEYAALAKKVGMSSLALTDHGTMSGILRFSNACKKEGINGIIGCEFYINNRIGEFIPKGEKNPNAHVVILSKNKRGYKNMLKINYHSFVEGFYYRARISRKFLFEHSEGTICLTACMGGEIPQLIGKGERKAAENLLLEYKEVFGDDLYGELEFNEIEAQQKVTWGMYELCKKNKVKFVLTGDCHYLNPKDVKIQDMLLMINTKKTVSSKDPFRFEARSLYFHSAEDYLNLNEDFGFNLPVKVVEEAIARTEEVADKCKFDDIGGSGKFPVFIDEDGIPVNANAVLSEKCYSGLGKIIESAPLSKGYDLATYQSRMKHELQVISNRGFSDYFLIIEDIIRFCEKENIAIGAGRGSAAGSLVSYSLGITRVDPILHKLLFERFLNEVRKATPDIDLDFESGRKDKIEEYLKAKYGKDHVAHIITFNNFRQKGALRSVARVLEKSNDDEFKTIIKKIEDDPPNVPVGTYSIGQQMKIGEWTSREKEYMKKNKTLFGVAGKLVGRINHVGQHAAGVAITAEKLSEYIPVYKIKGSIVTGFTEGKDGKELSECGVLKIDILGLDQVTMLKQAKELADSSSKKELDLDSIDLEDPELFKSLREEPSNGIFQLESESIDAFTKRIEPRCFEDVVAINALHRPAVMNAGEHERYLKRKKKAFKWEEEHGKPYKYETEVGKILSSTYGVIAYQEQFMMILHKLGNFSLDEADKARKTFEMRGKKGEEELDKVVDRFRKAATLKGYDDKYVDSLIDALEKFSEYGFNRSHSVSYSVVTMQTLYMRKYHPLCFYTALLNNTKNEEVMHSNFRKENKVKKYIYYMKKKGIGILSMDINESKTIWFPQNGSIRPPLTLVKGIGSSFSKAIRVLGPYSSFSDFCLKELKIRSNSACVLNLINVGAFDRFGYHKRALFNFYSEWSKIKSKYKHAKEEKTLPIIKSLWRDYKNDGEYTFVELKCLEKSLIRFNILYRYPDEVKRKIDYLVKNEKIISFVEADSVSRGFCIEIISSKLHIDKNDKEMKFLTVLDHEGNKLEAIAFSGEYRKSKEQLERKNYEDNFYVVYGHLNPRGELVIDSKGTRKIFTSLESLKNI